MKFGLEKFTINFPMEKLKLSFRKTNLLDLKKKKKHFFHSHNNILPSFGSFNFLFLISTINSGFL